MAKFRLKALAPTEHQIQAAMMALLKLARIKHSEGKHRDSYVDLAGYAAVGAEVSEISGDAV